jgi:hypothetical protein
MFGRGEPVETQVEEHEAASVAPAPDRDGEAKAVESPIGRLRPSLASLMVEEGVATSEQLEQALAEGQQNGERLGEVVLRHGWINEAGLAGLIARQWDLSFVALSAISLDDSARTLLSRDVCKRVGACPVSYDDGVPVLATSANARGKSLPATSASWPATSGSSPSWRISRAASARASARSKQSSATRRSASSRCAPSSPSTHSPSRSTRRHTALPLSRGTLSA